ncbi:MAG: PAS domain S-box protein, partial [Candidatus Rokubacteria bacterium]|nr:PAS domain S-box protein [Candidatus Rokubacteria bacterium]
TTGKLTLALLQPAVDEAGIVRAVLIVGLDLDRLSQLLGRVEMPPGTTLGVVDQNGLLLARSPEPEKWVGKPAPDAVLEAIRTQHREGTTEGTGEDGVARLYAFTPLSAKVGGSIWMYAGIPKGSVFAESNRDLTRNVLGLGLVGVLALGVAWGVGTRSIVRPVDALVRAAERLGAGDPSARSGLPHDPGSLGRLARAFDEMAMELERQSAELQEAEAQYRALFESNPHPMWVYDLDTLRFLAVNDAAISHYGYSREEFLAMTLKDIRPPEDVQALLEKVSRVADGLDVGGIWRHRKKDGAIIEVEITGNGLTFGGRRARVVLANDVTERKRVEEQRRIQSAALEAAASGIVITDRDGTIIWVNPAFTGMTGHTAGQAIGQTPRILTSGQHDPTFYKNLWEAILSGEVWHGEIINRRKDGSLYAEDQTITPVRDPHGEISHFVAIKQDITERQRLQEQLVQSEKLATLGELIAGIAHELNNPLTTVVGHAQMLRMDQQDPKVMARAERIIDGAHRATRIVRNFLAAARRHRPEKVAVSLNEVVAKTLELLTYQLRVSNIQLETALTPDLPPIGGDPHQLQQVILNLLTNATQAMASHGRGRLRVASALTPDRSTIRITVADDGPGIPPEHLHRIFDPFFTTKPAGEGTGLGLTLAKGIVNDHGGTITVESAPGPGATFVMMLPVTAPPALKPAPSRARAIPAGLNVLVVDDEPSVLEVMEDALLGCGARVQTAAAGREALEVIPRAPLDVLVLDVRMPEMSGTDLWEQIKKTDPALAERTVFCTGDVIGEKTRAFLDATGCLVVTKPFELSQFLEAVAQAAAR